MGADHSKPPLGGNQGFEGDAAFTGSSFTSSGGRVLGHGPLMALQTIDPRVLFSVEPLRAERVFNDYFGAFGHAFPDERERAPLQRYYNKLHDPMSPLIVQAFVSDGKVVGGVHYRILDTGKERVGFCEHFWINPDLQGSALHLTLSEENEAIIKAHGVDALIREMYDPNLVDLKHRDSIREGGLSPESRLAVWEKQGWKVLDAPYLQPALAGREVGVEDLMLGFKPLSERVSADGMPIEQYTRILKAYFNSFLDNAAESPDCRWLDAALSEQQFVKAIPLNQPRTCIGADVCLAATADVSAASVPSIDI